MYCSQKTYVILIPVILFTAANDLILDMEIDNDNSINVKEWIKSCKSTPLTWFLAQWVRIIVAIWIIFFQLLKWEITSVGSEPKLSSARLSFGSSFWEKKLSSARLSFQKAQLGLPCLPKSSARLTISCIKGSVQLGLLYHLKNPVT